MAQSTTTNRGRPFFFHQTLFFTLLRKKCRNVGHLPFTTRETLRFQFTLAHIVAKHTVYERCKSMDDGGNRHSRLCQWLPVVSSEGVKDPASKIVRERSRHVAQSTEKGVLARRAVKLKVERVWEPVLGFALIPRDQRTSALSPLLASNAELEARQGDAKGLLSTFSVSSGVKTHFSGIFISFLL